MVGQAHLQKVLRSYTTDTFPRSALICGERGSGKHTIVKMIADEIVKLPLLDISEQISNEYIDEIYRNPNPYIYLIDLSMMTEKEQNIILKFVEEPLNNSFIILITESKTGILPTVINRCICFEMDKYSKEELKQFLQEGIDCEEALDILRTPGKILSMNLSRIPELFRYCDMIVTKLGQASLANALHIGSKINFKDDYDKFDVDIFFDSLCFTMISEYMDTNDINILKMYSLTREHRKTLLDKRINREISFNNYIVKLWKLWRKLYECA